MYFGLSFTEFNGEQEYSYNKLIKANSLKEAEDVAHNFLLGWYGNGKYDIFEDYYEYDGGRIIVRKIMVNHTTIKDFLLNQTIILGLNAGEDLRKFIENFSD